MSLPSTSEGKGYVIAIDGPVASGKGTLAPRLAKKLNGFYLYSGSVFRCLGYLCLQKNINTKDEAAVETEIHDVQIVLPADGRVILQGIDVTEQLKQEVVGMAASNVGVFSAVRSTMVRIMREIAAEKIKEGIIVITEGRDMATTVFPDAKYKIFLTASPQIRAKRRLAQAHSRGEQHLTIDKVLADTVKRDQQDSSRAISPLAKDPEKLGYTVVDDSEMTEQESITRLLSLVGHNT